MEIQEYLRKMKADWDERARQNARHFIVNVQPDWSDSDFYASGERAVAEDILTDMTNICQGQDPKQMKVLEIGCGAGRVTRALSTIFGEVHGADVSSEMVRLARASVPSAFIHQIDGATLPMLAHLKFDFAYSCCMFHHIANYEIIQSLVCEVGRILRTGALFKFEVQGCSSVISPPDDTWLGIPFSIEQATEMAHATGFELRFHSGAGEERFWLWYFKR